MKVLFTFNGMPHYLTALLNFLQEKYNIEIVTVLPKGKSSTIANSVKQVTEGIKFKIIYTDEKIWFFKKPYFRELYKIIDKEKPDLLTICWPDIIGFVFDAKLKKIIKKNNVGVIFREIPFNVARKNEAFSYYKKFPIYDENLNNITPKGLYFYLWAFVFKIIRQIYYRRIDGSIVYADIGKEILKSYGVKEDKIFVSGNSPDTNKIFRIKKKLENTIPINEKQQFSVIHIGRLVKWKKVDLLLKSIHLLKKEFNDIKLNIVGTGPEKENLEKLTKELNLEANVSFLGGIYDYENLGKILMQNNIYVLAGMGGLSINDAMAFGKPIICSVCDGTEKRLVKNSKNGFYFKENDVDDLTEKLQIFFRNPKLIEKFGKESERIILEEENIKTVSNRIFKAFKYINENKKYEYKNN